MASKFADVSGGGAPAFFGGIGATFGGAVAKLHDDAVIVGELRKELDEVWMLRTRNGLLLVEVASPGHFGHLDCHTGAVVLPNNGDVESCLAKKQNRATANDLTWAYKAAAWGLRFRA